MVNVVLFNISLTEGMAGSMRVKNLLSPLYKKDEILLSNLIVTNIFEKNKIGDGGINDGIPYLNIGYTSSVNVISLISFYRHGCNFIKREFKKNMQNIFYIYDYPDIKNIGFINYAKKVGYKIVFDIVEDNRFQSQFFSILGWLRSKTSIYFLKKIPVYADAIIVISKHLEKRLFDICGSTMPIYHIPVVVNTSQLENDFSTLNDTTTVFYGGSFGEKDGLIFLLQAFKILEKKYSNIKLVFTGKPTFESDLTKLKIEGQNILYKGFLSEDQYYNELKNADIFCMLRVNSPWANAGFPFKLCEFLATGKGVIATDVGDVSDYIENGKNALLIKPGSVEEIVGAIEFFLIHPDKIFEMGKLARQTAIKYFDSNYLSGKVITIFNSIK